jgi:hypothetical protein
MDAAALLRYDLQHACSREISDVKQHSRPHRCSPHVHYTGRDLSAFTFAQSFKLM